MNTTPHPILKPHYNSFDEKQKFLRSAFDAAAPFYEGIAKWGFFGSGEWYRKEALARHGLKPGMKVIDVASGTGPTARAALQIVGSPSLVTCVEPSGGMLEESRKQLDCVHIQASADDIPLPSGVYDFLTMGFALRHVNDLQGSFCEYFRVLKPGGIACILDVTKPKNTFGQIIFRLYFKFILPFMTRIFTGSRAAEYLMQYYWDTMDSMVPADTVLHALRIAGFTDVKQKVLLSVFTEYSALKPQ